MINKRGLTLLELILALTMISIIFLATANLNLSSLRITADVREETKLLNELEYVLRDAEITLMPTRDPVISEGESCAAGATQCLGTYDPSTGTPILYIYRENAQGIGTLSKMAGGPETILSSGALIRKTDPASGNPLPIFVIPSGAGDLVEINLAARGVDNIGRVVTVPGITKSIWLRGVN